MIENVQSNGVNNKRKEVRSMYTLQYNKTTKYANTYIGKTKYFFRMDDAYVDKYHSTKDEIWYNIAISNQGRGRRSSTKLAAMYDKANKKMYIYIDNTKYITKRSYRSGDIQYYNLELVK